MIVRRSFLASGLCAAVAAPARAQEGRTYADELTSQSWAARKLAASPRRKDWVDIDAGGRAVRACIIYPDDKPKAPVVLVLHEVFGLTPSTLNTADEIAAMGYIAVVPDMLSGLAPGGGGTPAFASSRDAAEANTSVAPEIVNARVNAVAAYGLALPRADDRLAIVGLSWGGGEAFRYAADPAHDKALKLVAVFYDVGPPALTQGSGRTKADDPPVPVAAIDVPVYGFYGGTDTRVMNSLQATKDEMAAAGKSYRPFVFAGADHAFLRLGEDPGNANPANVVAVRSSLAQLRTILGAM